LSKLVLGTVQFGLNYGINNKTGVIDNISLFDLLDFAYDNGVDTLDTAYNYGESEKRLGQIINSEKLHFDIVSKTPKGSNSQNISHYVQESFERLRIDFFHGYLLHDFNDYLNDKDIFKYLIQLKESGCIQKIGFSLYNPEQLETLFYDNVVFDLVQIPYNLADRRFEKYFEALKHRNIEIHARSVFLQGLFFMKQNELPNKLKPVGNFLDKLNELSKEINRSIENISLNFVLQNNFIDKAVIGVDTINQLNKNIKTAKNKLKKEAMELIGKELTKIVFPSELFVPSNWD